MVGTVILITDEKILYYIKRFFSGYDFFITSDWSDDRLEINELNQCDYVLIGGGGFILRDVVNYTDLSCRDHVLNSSKRA